MAPSMEPSMEPILIWTLKDLRMLSEAKCARPCVDGLFQLLLDKATRHKQRNKPLETTHLATRVTTRVVHLEQESPILQILDSAGQRTVCWCSATQLTLKLACSWILRWLQPVISVCSTDSSFPVCLGCQTDWHRLAQSTLCRRQARGGVLLGIILEALLTSPCS